MPTLAEALGQSFGGGVYSNHAWNLRDDFIPYISGDRQAETGIAPSAPPTPVQQSLPTSAYGQTIPVIYAKARVPGGYIWAPDFETDNVSGITILTARLRFAAPLVADSSWAVRRLWADGALVLDASQGYRAAQLQTFRPYDGRSTQGRDSLMVEIEGEANVSAHRGYLDIVIQYQIDGAKPPVFEAEWVQDAAVSATATFFTTFIGEEIDSLPAPYWQGATFYGYSDGANAIRRFNIGSVREVYSVPLTTASRAYTTYAHFRYIPEIGQLVALGFFSPNHYAIMISPTTGAITAESADGLNTGFSTTCHIRFSNASVVVGAQLSERIFAFQYTDTTVTRTFLSDTSWGGYTAFECMAPGENDGSFADLWICADNKLVKARVSSAGFVSFVSEHASFANDLRYCIFHDGDIIVWTDNAQAIRIDGSTGATVWTKTVPYQVETTILRGLAPPDQNRFEGTFYFQESTRYNFTDLDTGDTTELAKSSSSAFLYAYDGRANWLVTTNNTTSPIRTIFDDVGDGAIRDLDDFIAAVWEYGQGFGSSEHDEVGIDDQIQGGIIDVTIGTREVVRSVAGPYALSIFERSGQIITKRAATDDSFAVDVILSSNDFVDRGGQAIKARKLNPEEFIARYGVSYRDPDEVYQTRTQYGEIQFTPFPVSPTDMATKVDVPIIHDADSVKTLATKRVRRLAEEKHEFTGSLRAKHLDLEPEDIVQITYAGRTIHARVGETTINPDFSVDMRATEFLSKVAATVQGATGRPTEPQPIGTPESEYYHLDIPLQSDSDDLGGAGFVQYHVLTSQGQLYWDGATLYVRSSNGVYSPAISQTEDGLVGVALSALPDIENPYVTEFTRTINVAFLTGDTSLLATKTYLEVMNGANKFAVGAPGRWEICHVITITDNGDGTFTFEGLVRGRGVSEEHTGSHQQGDFVIWLSDDNLQHLDYSLDSLDDSFDYKPVGFGGNITTTPSVNRTVTGEAEKIPKPAQLDAVIDGADIDLSWVRCGRIGVTWADNGEDEFTTPLGETLEQYVIRIKSGPGGSVLRTFTVDDATTKTYLAADISTDFGSTPAALTFDARQVSGTGVTSPTREATITL